MLSHSATPWGPARFAAGRDDRGRGAAGRAGRDDVAALVAALRTCNAADHRAASDTPGRGHAVRLGRAEGGHGSPALTDSVAARAARRGALSRQAAVCATWDRW